MSSLMSAGDVDEFLESRLSSEVAPLVGRRMSDDVSLGSLQSAYEQLRSGLGYVSLRELALAAVGLALSVPEAPLFEIGKVEGFLKAAAGDNSRNVRLALGRNVGTAQVRISGGAFSG